MAEAVDEIHMLHEKSAELHAQVAAAEEAKQRLELQAENDSEPVRRCAYVAEQLDRSEAQREATVRQTLKLRENIHRLRRSGNNTRRISRIKLPGYQRGVTYEDGSS